MAFQIQSFGLTALLPNLLSYLSGLTLHLYQNNYQPTKSDTVANYTEATFPGYASVSLNTWGTVYQNGNGDAETDEQIHTFTCTGTSPANTVYGYYVTDASNNLIFAESNPIGGTLVNTASQTYVAQPRLVFTSP